MKTVEQLIEQIDWQVWYYNSYHDSKKEWHSELRDNTSEIVPIIKMYCETILKAKTDKGKIVKEAVENIIKYCRPENYKESSMYIHNKWKEGRLEEMPKFVAENILESCNELSNACKSADDMDLHELNKKWANKYLYFNGDESGQQIIWMSDIHWDRDELVFDGTMIEFFNENSDPGEGVRLTDVTNYSFEQLHYIDYLDNDLLGDDDPDDLREENIYRWVDIALSSAPIDSDKTSRIMDVDDVKAEVSYYMDCIIDDWIYEKH